MRKKETLEFDTFIFAAIFTALSKIDYAHGSGSVLDNISIFAIKSSFRINDGSYFPFIAYSLQVVEDIPKPKKDCRKIILYGI